MRLSRFVLLCAFLTGCASQRAASVAATWQPGRDLFTDASAGDALRTEIAAHPEGDAAQVHRLVANYLDAKTREYRCGPSTHWIAAEQGWYEISEGFSVPRCHDIGGSMIDPHDTPEVLRIELTTGTTGREYRITTRYRNAASPMSRTALYTVFAVREDNAWKLAGAIDRFTSGWQRETVGPFTYVIQPGHKFSRSRADAAVAFADSLSRAFDVAPIKPLHYYIVATADEMLRITGYHSDTTYGTAGGRSSAGLIISGDPVFAEKHGHEIAHTVLSPLYAKPGLHVAASEGVPTWLGGTRSLHYHDALKKLRAHLLAHPDITLDTIIDTFPPDIYNPGVALLSAMVHDHGGPKAIAAFFVAGSETAEFKRGVERILGKSWSEIAVDWKVRALAASP